jgi:hypothetical protein
MIEFIHDQCQIGHYPISKQVRVQSIGRLVDVVELECGLFGVLIHNYFHSIEPVRVILNEKTFAMLSVAIRKIEEGCLDDTFEIVEDSFEGEFIKPPRMPNDI